MWEYTDTVREHFLSPRNVGALEGANAIGEVGSLACGDALKLYLKIDDTNHIVAATFETFGCASAIASSSALTEMLIGKTVAEAEKITNKDIVAYLGGLPPEKMHCSVMGEEALDTALRNWRGEAPRAHGPEGKIVCRCFAVTDEQIRKAIRENDLKTVRDVTRYTKAGGGCGDCKDSIQAILDEEHGKPTLEPISPVARKMTNMQRMQLVMKTIEEDIRPQLALDGGDIDLIDIEGETVLVSLRGRCSQCRSSALTIKGLVEKTLREQVDPAITVQEV